MTVTAQLPWISRVPKPDVTHAITTVKLYSLYKPKLKNKFLFIEIHKL